MGNQQERSLAWLAGVLEAEGSISVQVYTLPDGRIRLTPFLCLVNTDMAILKETKRILDGLTFGLKAHARFCGHGGTNTPCHVMRLDGPTCKPVLEALMPHMIGEKLKNARVVCDFIKSRATGLLLRDTRGRIQRVGYTLAEIDLISSIRKHKSAKSSETLRQAPNVIGDDKVRSAMKVAERGRNDRATSRKRKG